MNPNGNQTAVNARMAFDAFEAYKERHMSELLTEITALLNKRENLETDRRNYEASALQHEDAARKDRAAIVACKTEIAAIDKTIGNNRVKVAVETAQQSAAKAQADAEASRKAAKEAEERIAAKEARVDEMLAKLNAQVTKDEGEPAEPDPE